MRHVVSGQVSRFAIAILLDSPYRILHSSHPHFFAKPAPMPYSWNTPAICCWLLLFLCGSTPLRAWGPENLFLVVNSRQLDSVTVANNSAALRNIPPSNIFYLPLDKSAGTDV